MRIVNGVLGQKPPEKTGFLWFLEKNSLFNAIERIAKFRSHLKKLKYKPLQLHYLKVKSKTH